MSLTTQDKSGTVSGRMSYESDKDVHRLVMIFVLFTSSWSHTADFHHSGHRGVLGLSSSRSPARATLQGGARRNLVFQRLPILLDCLPGRRRQQVFFSFGLWVLVSNFGLGCNTYRW